MPDKGFQTLINKGRSLNKEAHQRPLVLHLSYARAIQKLADGARAILDRGGAWPEEYEPVYELDRYARRLRGERQ